MFQRTALKLNQKDKKTNTNSQSRLKIFRDLSLLKSVFDLKTKYLPLLCSLHQLKWLKKESDWMEKEILTNFLNCKFFEPQMKDVIVQMYRFSYWLFNTLYLHTPVSRTAWNTRSEGLGHIILERGNRGKSGITIHLQKRLNGNTNPYYLEKIQILVNNQSSLNYKRVMEFKI